MHTNFVGSTPWYLRSGNRYRKAKRLLWRTGARAGIPKKGNISEVFPTERRLKVEKRLLAGNADAGSAAFLFFCLFS